MIHAQSKGSSCWRGIIGIAKTVKCFDVKHGSNDWWHVQIVLRHERGLSDTQVDDCLSPKGQSKTTRDDMVKTTFLQHTVKASTKAS